MHRLHRTITHGPIHAHVRPRHRWFAAGVTRHGIRCSPLRGIAIGALGMVLCGMVPRNVSALRRDGRVTGGPAKTVTFAHQGCALATGAEECRASYVLDVADGETFLVAIEKTIPKQFTYTVAGIELPETLGRESDDGRVETKTIPQRHDARYGGYIVTIRRSKTGESLPNATLVIAVRTIGWRVDFGGGFTATGLRNQAYGLRDEPGPTAGTTTTRIVRNRDLEDDASLGAATFAHLHHTRVPWGAISFGLGLSLNRTPSTAYYLGPSFRFGDRGAITFGAVLGPERVLPVGLREGDVVTDRTTIANALATGATRNRMRWFIGVSYSFLGGGTSALNKPFAGSPEAPTTKTAVPVSPPPAPQASSGASAGTGSTGTTAAPAIGMSTSGPVIQSVTVDVAPASPVVMSDVTVRVRTTSPDVAALAKARVTLTAEPADAAEIAAVRRELDATGSWSGPIRVQRAGTIGITATIQLGTANPSGTATIVVRE